MSEKDVTRFLQILGLSKRETQVYMFLAKSGVQSTSFVAKRLKMERVQAYRTFKKLQEKGFIEATLERPTRFTIVPFSALVDNFITAKKERSRQPKRSKTKLNDCLAIDKCSRIRVSRRQILNHNREEKDSF
jgi:sugar-specific transcriptional regulator TrmB